MKNLVLLGHEDTEDIITALEMAIEALDEAANDTLYKKSVRQNCRVLSNKYFYLSEWLKANL